MICLVLHSYLHKPDHVPTSVYAKADGSVGVNGVLYISMYRYDPGHIECGAEPRPGFQDGCNKMAQGINAAKGDQTFGKAGDTGVQQGLPYISMTPSGFIRILVMVSGG